MAIDRHVASGPPQAGTHRRSLGPRSACPSRLAVAVDLMVILVSLQHEGAVQGLAHRSPDALALWGADPLPKVLHALNRGFLAVVVRLLLRLSGPTAVIGLTLDVEEGRTG